MQNLMSKNIREWLTSIEDALCRVAKLINSCGWILVPYFGVVYFLMARYRAERKLFWFDELFTLYLSRLPDFSSLMDALKQGTDFNPPLFYEWVRISEFFLGDEHLGVRMPSIIGVGLLCLCLYRFVAIRSSVLGGLVACLFPLVTTALHYSYEARSHGIVLGFAGLALICWQSAVDPVQFQRRLWWLGGLGIALVCATLTHGYALVIFAPLALGELSRCLSCKRVDWAVWITFAIASTAMLVPFWLLHIVKEIVPPVEFFSPSFLKLVESYPASLGGSQLIISFAFVLFLIEGLLSGSRPSCEFSQGGPFKFEIVACLGFIAVPFIVFLLSTAMGSPQLARYSLSCVVGFAALLGFSVSTRPVLGLCLIVLLATLIGIDFLKYSRSDHIFEPSTNWEVSTDRWMYFEQYKLMEKASDQLSPIVIILDESGLDFAPLLHYAPSNNLRQRLTVLVWKETDINKLGYKRLQDCCNAVGNLVDANDFLKTHKRFLAFTYNHESLIELSRFSKLGAEVTLQQVNSRGALFDIRLP